jgi:diguanylate cyclase (GGDEF)-like protein
VILSDLDHFKAVNDHYGHPGGDEVLRAFGDLIRQHSRSSDICCRYGGEEFLLVLPEMAKDNAVARAEQLCLAMSNFAVPFGASAIKVTGSFGVATFPQDGRTAGELIAAADRALHAAKAAGRNRVNVSTGLFGGPA